LVSGENNKGNTPNLEEEHLYFAADIRIEFGTDPTLDAVPTVRDDDI
jgi:hypothetical protein